MFGSMLLTRRAFRPALTLSSGHDALWLSLALALAGCGSQRLDTAFEPVGQDGTGGVGPLATEPLVTFANFGDGYMVGTVTAQVIEVSGQPFTQAWRATMSEPPSSPLSGQLVVPLNEPVQAGQLLHVSFWLNCETVGPTGDCYTEYIFERASDPWEKSVTFAQHAQSAWSQKSEFFSVVSSYETGAAHMVFRLGYATQVIAIGGLEVEAIDPLP